MQTHLSTRTVLLLVLALANGCSNQRDERLARLAEQSIHAQARQNEQMADQSRQIAEASRELVAADAEARRELTEAQAALQQDLQQERSSLDRQREDLERHRRELARQRRTDPVVAEAIMAVGVLLACIAPLALAGYVLYTASRPEKEADAMNELLVSELVSERPLLLPRAPRSPPQLCLLQRDRRTGLGRRRAAAKSPRRPAELPVVAPTWGTAKIVKDRARYLPPPTRLIRFPNSSGVLSRWAR